MTPGFPLSNTEPLLGFIAPQEVDPNTLYKVQSLLALLPPFYNTLPGSVLNGILCAIGSSDNDIGGR